MLRSCVWQQNHLKLALNTEQDRKHTRHWSVTNTGRHLLFFLTLIVTANANTPMEGRQRVAVWDHLDRCCGTEHFTSSRYDTFRCRSCRSVEVSCPVVGQRQKQVSHKQMHAYQHGRAIYAEKECQCEYTSRAFRQKVPGGQHGDGQCGGRYCSPAKKSPRAEASGSASP